MPRAKRTIINRSRTHIFLPPKLMQRAKKKAQADGVSFSEIIRRALDLLLAA